MAVRFEDYSAQVKDAMNAASIAWLYEFGETLASQTADNSRFDKGDLRNSWMYKVDKSKGKCTVGSPLQNAIWDEFGTGEYAMKQNGRSGYWVYVKGGSSKKTSTGGKQYTLAEAKRIVAMMREDGLEAYYTKGKPPKRAFFNAFNTLKEPFIRRYAQIMKERLNK